MNEWEGRDRKKKIKNSVIILKKDISFLYKIDR